MKFKKILALALCCVMAVGLLPAVSFADDSVTRILACSDFQNPDGNDAGKQVVSAVVQVMATHAHAYLLNDYYEVALKNKYAQDRTSAQMLDMVVAGISAPFEFAYELGFGDASYLAGISWNPVGDSITKGTDVTASGGAAFARSIPLSRLSPLGSP